jgi:neutral ceramidase
MRRVRCLLGLLLGLLAASCAWGQGIQAGTGRRDITPREPLPMWGYGDRHDALSEGVLDPLYADALVIQAGGRKIAIVGLDLGRSPAEASLERIRRRIQEQGGIEYSIIAGSHTHHGPVLELTGEAGKGKGRFDAALDYYAQMEDGIVAAILEANAKLAPARIAVGSTQLDGFNRNRQTKIEPKASDRELAVMRFDNAAGKPLAIVVNFAAHPTMLPASTLRFSADYVGALKAEVTRETGAAAIFLQGAAGDQSVNEGTNHYASQGYEAFGQALGRQR